MTIIHYTVHLLGNNLLFQKKKRLKKWMIMLLILVLVGILKNISTNFIINMRNVQRVILKTFQTDTEKKDEILQQGRNKYAHFKDLDNRLKALEEKLSIFKLTT